MTLAAVNVDVLRRGWDDAVSALAPNLPELTAMLESRLGLAQNDGRLDEGSLLAIVDDAGAAVAEAGGPDLSWLLTRRLQRAVYEYLLSLDALAPEETSPSPLELARHDGRGYLIGVEEVAELAGRQALVTADGVAVAEAPASAADPPPAGEAETAAAPAPESEAEIVAERGSVAENGVPSPPSPTPDPPAAMSFVVAPRDGFHLTDYPDLLPPSRPDDDGRVTILEDIDPAAVPLTFGEPAPPPLTAEPAAEEGGRGWHIRRPGQDNEKKARRGASDHLLEQDEEDDGESRARFENDPPVIEARRQISDRLRRRRCDEAASLLQKLAADLGGRLVSELALDAGDRCRALGKGNA